MSSLPDTSTAQGAALNVFRLVFRSVLVVFIYYKFFKAVYALYLKG